MKKTEGKNASIFELNGVPQLSKALPLALQHVVAMIVGCVTPAIIVAGVAGLEGANRVMLIQSALVVSALSTFLQLFPIGPKNGFRMGQDYRLLWEPVLHMWQVCRRLRQIQVLRRYLEHRSSVVSLR